MKQLTLIGNLGADDMDKTIYRPIWVYWSMSAQCVMYEPSDLGYKSRQKAYDEAKTKWEDIKENDKLIHIDIEEITIV